MINFNAYVIELEADNTYTFEFELTTVSEIMLSNDYDYIEVARGKSRKGRPCRKYVISVDNGDD